MTSQLRLTEESLRIAAVADALVVVARELLHAGDPALTWATWLQANLGDIETSALALGVDIEQGPHYVQRLRSTVLSRLRETSKP